MADGYGDSARAAMQDAQFATYTNIYVALWVGDPGVNGQTGTEATGTGYAPVTTVPANWAAATVADPSVKANGILIDWGTAGGDWSGLAAHTHFCLWSHVSNRASTDFIGSGLLSASKIINSGDPVTAAIGALALNITG